MLPGCQVNCKAPANTPPAWFFAPPLNSTTGPGQLFAIEQTAAGTNYLVAEVASRTRQHLPMVEGMGFNGHFFDGQHSITNLTTVSRCQVLLTHPGWQCDGDRHLLQ